MDANGAAGNEPEMEILIEIGPLQAEWYVNTSRQDWKSNCHQGGLITVFLQ